MLCSSGLPDLDDLASVLGVASQRRPARSVRLRQGHLQLRAHDFERRFLRIDGRVQRNLRLISLLVRRRQVQIDGQW